MHPHLNCFLNCFLEFTWCKHLINSLPRLHRVQRAWQCRESDLNHVAKEIVTFFIKWLHRECLLVKLYVRSPQSVHPVHYGLEVALHQEFECSHVCIELRKVKVYRVRLKVQLPPLFIDGFTLNRDQAKYSTNKQDWRPILFTQMLFVFQYVVVRLVLNMSGGRRNFETGREEDLEHLKENEDWLLELLLHTLEELTVKVFLVLAQKSTLF